MSKEFDPFDIPKMRWHTMEDIYKWWNKAKPVFRKLQEENEAWQICFIKLGDETEQKLGAIKKVILEGIVSEHAFNRIEEILGND